MYCPIFHCSTLQPSINPFAVNNSNDNNKDDDDNNNNNKDDDDNNNIPDDLIFICHGGNLKSKTLSLSKVAKQLAILPGDLPLWIINTFGVLSLAEPVQQEYVL